MRLFSLAAEAYRVFFFAEVFACGRCRRRSHGLSGGFRAVGAYGVRAHGCVVTRPGGYGQVWWLECKKEFPAMLLSGTLLSVLAEREGFEPPEPLSSSVFKTGAIDHSATFPSAKV